MRGRKPQAVAVRRGGADGVVIQADASTVDGITKPGSIAAVPSMSRTWDAIVGHGFGYRESDVPFIAQLVFNVEVANQAFEKCLGEDGTLKLMVPKYNRDGDICGERPNPYIKQANDSAAVALKLADQLGCTPLARARLGLTQNMSGAVQLSIAQQIDAAIAGRK